MAETDLITGALGWLEQAGQIAAEWLMSPAAWSQFALLAVAYLVARLVSGRLSPVITRGLTPPAALSCAFCRCCCRCWPMP